MGKLKSRKPTGGKRLPAPSASYEIPPEQKPPVFSLQFLGGHYCLTQRNLGDKAAFADKIHRLSQITWSQIQSQDKHKLGYEKILRNSIKATIPPHLKPDVNLIAFRFSGMKPMVGYREGAVFYVIWLDRDFTLYDHG